MQGKHTSIKRERDENDSYDQTFFGGKIPLKELGEQRKLRRYFFPFERGERKI